MSRRVIFLALQAASNLQTPPFPTHFLPKPLETGCILIVKTECTIPKSAIDVRCLATNLDLVFSCTIYRWLILVAFLGINYAGSREVVEELRVDGPATQSIIASTEQNQES